MKYVLAGLAVVAAVAALVFRPPHLEPAAIPLQQEPRPARADAVPARTRVNQVVVYVAGAVRKPGVYSLSANSRAVDALARAGGALPDADLIAVNLAAPLSDGDEIAVRKIGEASSTARASRGRRAHPRKRRGRGHASHRAHDAAPTEGTAPAAASIDLNSADAVALEDVPGIGPALAERIVEYREQNGPFASTDELADVSGITPRLQDALAAFVFVR